MLDRQTAPEAPSQPRAEPSRPWRSWLIDEAALVAGLFVAATFWCFVFSFPFALLYLVLEGLGWIPRR